MNASATQMVHSRRYGLGDGRSPTHGRSPRAGKNGREKEIRPPFPRFEALALPVLRAAFPVYVAVVVVLSLLPLAAELPGQVADKLAHFAAYGIMALLGMPLVNVGRSRLVMLLAIVAVGTVLEGLQLMLPYRDPSALDLVANCLGAIAGAGLWLVVLGFAAVK